MVLIWAGFCVVASLVAFAVYALFPISDRMPAPILVFFVVVDFIIAPLGALAGGLLRLSGANDACGSPTVGAP